MTMEHKHIDPEPKRRYIISTPNTRPIMIESATVIEVTDKHVRLKWDPDGRKQWLRKEWFQPMGPAGTNYIYQILEQINPE